MTPILATAFEWISLWFLAFVLGSWLSAMIYQALRRILLPCHASVRSLATLLLGVIPPLASLLVLVLVMHPDWATFLVPEHCHEGHCDSHAPVFLASSFGGMALVATSLMVMCLLLGFCLRNLHYGQQRIAALFRLASGNTTPRFEVIESPGLLAWCCGLIQPKVLVSRGLLDRLTPAQLEVVLVHEEEHARRKDNLRHVALLWCTVFWPGRIRQRIRADVTADAEESCDRAACKSAEDPAMLRTVMELLRQEVPHSEVRARSAFFHSPRKLGKGAIQLPQTASSLRAWSATWFSWLAHIVVLTGLAHFILEWISGLSN
jgi:hypothetical protein